MSTAHITKFAEIVTKDAELLARLGLDHVSDEASAANFITKAVKEAKPMGLEFTEEEGHAWMKAEAAIASKDGIGCDDVRFGRPRLSNMRLTPPSALLLLAMTLRSDCVEYLASDVYAAPCATRALGEHSLFL
jgi:hypothetical protein